MSFHSFISNSQGCCKVISHRDFGRHVFVGSVFTNTPASVGVIEDLFLDLRLALNKQGEATSA